jgi:alkanesulfonate monooxygenase SsuD/methylene tetrahydromethanopterin reductase-like flavin-dependent oxidoreductase (luciferase family)
MSNAWRGLSAWFPGRFVLGLGVSHQPIVERLGGPSAKPLGAMERYLDELERAPWDGPPVGEGGGATHVVLAALGPKMLALAGERTDGAHPYTSPAVHSAQARAVLGPSPCSPPRSRSCSRTTLPRRARSPAARCP